MTKRMYDDPKVGDVVECRFDVIRGTMQPSSWATNRSGLSFVPDGGVERLDGLNPNGNKDKKRTMLLISRAPVVVKIGKTYRNLDDALYTVVGEDRDRWVFRRQGGSYDSCPKTSTFWPTLIEVGTQV